MEGLRYRQMGDAASGAVVIALMLIALVSGAVGFVIGAAVF